MAVFRIERNRDYTVMSNHHLRDTELSLKSKGLLSMMLSLPEEWNYTTRGLAAICKEGADCIGSALRELEQAGYIVRSRLRDSKGKIVDVEYIIYETPHKPRPQSAPPEPERPDTENPDMDTPCPEMTAQLNKDKEKKDRSKKDLEITDEIHPIPSYRPSQETRMGWKSEIGIGISFWKTSTMTFLFRIPRSIRNSWTRSWRFWWIRSALPGKPSELPVTISRLRWFVLAF